MSAGPAVWLLYAFISASISSFLCFLISPLIAWKKGFAPYYWLFACGPIGLIALCCLPSLKSTTTPEDYERLESRANLIGGTLSIITIFLGFALMGTTIVGF